jgi:hypothetical protein
MKSRKSKDVVYIVIGGEEFKISDKGDAVQTLILATESSLPKKERLQFLDIKGLGLLKYQSRKIIRRKGKRRGLEYLLKFEQWTTV